MKSEGRMTSVYQGFLQICAAFWLQKFWYLAAAFRLANTIVSQ